MPPLMRATRAVRTISLSCTRQSGPSSRLRQPPRRRHPRRRRRNLTVLWVPWLRRSTSGLNRGALRQPRHHRRRHLPSLLQPSRSPRSVSAVDPLLPRPIPLSPVNRNRSCRLPRRLRPQRRPLRRPATLLRFLLQNQRRLRRLRNPCLSTRRPLLHRLPRHHKLPSQRYSSRPLRHLQPRPRLLRQGLHSSPPQSRDHRCLTRRRVLTLTVRLRRDPPRSSPHPSLTDIWAQADPWAAMSNRHQQRLGPVNVPGPKQPEAARIRLTGPSPDIHKTLRGVSRTRTRIPTWPPCSTRICPRWILTSPIFLFQPSVTRGSRIKAVDESSGSDE